jgi:hypothetical protein
VNGICKILNKQTKAILQSPRKTRTSQTQTSRRREIIKIKDEINEIESKKSIQRIDKMKSWVFEKINKIDKLLANLMKMRREKTQISKIRNKNREITTNTKKSRKSSETTLRNYIQINWKI